MPLTLADLASLPDRMLISAVSEQNSEQAKLNWIAHIPKLYPDELFAILTNELSGTTEVAISIERKGAGHIHLYDQGAALLSLRYSIPEKVAGIQDFDPPMSQLGGEIARALIINMIDAARAMTIQSIRHDISGRDGSYVWARLGLRVHPNDWPSVRKRILDRLTQVAGLVDVEVIKKIMHLCGSDDADGVWEIADERCRIHDRLLAKRLLWDLEWRGSFDLNDKRQMGRLKRYIGVR